MKKRQSFAQRRDRAALRAALRAPRLAPRRARLGRGRVRHHRADLLLPDVRHRRDGARLHRRAGDGQCRLRDRAADPHRPGAGRPDMTKADFTNEVCGRMSVFINCSRHRLLSRREVLRDLRRHGRRSQSPTDDERRVRGPGAFDFGEPNDDRRGARLLPVADEQIFGSLSLQNTAERQAADRLLRRLPQRAVYETTTESCGGTHAMSTIAVISLRAATRPRASAGFAPHEARHRGGGVLADPADPGPAVDRRRRGHQRAQRRPPAQQPRLVDRRSRGAQQDVTYAEVDDIFDLAPKPRCSPIATAGMSMRITAVDMRHCRQRQGRLDARDRRWSRARRH